MTAEDVFGWLRAAYKHIEAKPELIIKGFEKAGYINANNELGDLDVKSVSSDQESDLSSLISLADDEVFAFEEDNTSVIVEENYYGEYEKGNFED